MVKDTLNDPTYLPWRQHGIRLGYLSVIALPLVASGNVLGVLAIYSPDIDGFSAEEIKLLDELSDDLAFGIESVRIRHLQVLTAQRLMRSMEGSICLLYTSDAADERSSVDLGGRRIIKKKKEVDIDGR